MSQKIIFAPEDNSTKESLNMEEPWHVVVADDEGMVHMVTEMALQDFSFENRSLKLHNAYSAKEMLDIMKDMPDKIAIVLLDVVMESLNAGLEAVPLIRDEINDREVRIIIRTGQAGRTAIADIIKDYDINDIHEKTALDHTKLINVVTLALRNYRDICYAKNGE